MIIFHAMHRPRMLQYIIMQWCKCANVRMQIFRPCCTYNRRRQFEWFLFLSATTNGDNDEHRTVLLNSLLWLLALAQNANSASRLHDGNMHTDSAAFFFLFCRCETAFIHYSLRAENDLHCAPDSLLRSHISRTLTARIISLLLLDVITLLNVAA